MKNMNVLNKKYYFRRLLVVITVIALLFSLSINLPNASADELKTTVDISKASITIGNGTVTGKTTTGANAAYNPNGYIITGKTTTNTVTINGGASNITLQNLNISTGYNASAPISIENANTNVTLILSGTNNLLTSGNPKKAGLSVPEGTKLTIDTIDSTNSSSLSVNGYGGTAAAIGGNESSSAGTITINHGNITANFGRSGNYGAAIGGGQAGAGGEIVINDGIINAESYGGTAAAIGGGYSSTGYSGKATNVTINGGTITTKIPNTAAYDSIGYGSVGSSYKQAVQESTSVKIDGGNIVTKNDSGNITSLLYKRQPVNSSGTPLYSTGIKVDSSPTDGTPVLVEYAGRKLTTTTSNAGNVYLFLPIGVQDVAVTAASKIYYGSVATSSSTNNPNSTATVSKTIKTVPAIAIINEASNDTALNDGKQSTLSVANLGLALNNGNFPLLSGEDFTVQWYKGSTAINGDAGDGTKLTVTPVKGDIFKAKFVATADGKAIGSSSFSSVQTALGPKDPGVPAVGIETVLIVTSQGEFTKLPDPTAGAINYTVKLTTNDAAKKPIEGATVRFYQDGSIYPYTRVTGTGADAGVIQFTFSALLPGKHSIKIAFDLANVKDVLYNASSYTKDFTVIKPQPPTGFTTIAAKTDTTNGKIFGVNDTEEYIKWIPTIGINQVIYPVTGNVISDLGPSLYSIRYKASYNEDVYQIASDYRYLIWVQTAQWTVTPVETESVVWETGATDVIAGGSADFIVTPKNGYEIKSSDIQVKYANYSYDNSTHILSLSRITSDTRIIINASTIN